MRWNKGFSLSFTRCSYIRYTVPTNFKSSFYFLFLLRFLFVPILVFELDPYVTGRSVRSPRVYRRPQPSKCAEVYYFRLVYESVTEDYDSDFYFRRLLRYSFFLDTLSFVRVLAGMSFGSHNVLRQRDEPL